MIGLIIIVYPIILIEYVSILDNFTSTSTTVYRLLVFLCVVGVFWCTIFIQFPEQKRQEASVRFVRTSYEDNISSTNPTEALHK